MVARLISENRTLRRQVAKMAAKTKGASTKNVESGLRTISRRVERALGGKTARRRRVSTNGRRKRTATRRRRAA
jgi:hypothetical protein